MFIHRLAAEYRVRLPVLLLTLIATSTGLAQTLTRPLSPAKPNVSATKVDKWTVICSKTNSCIAALRVSSSDGKTSLLEWQIGNDSNNKLMNKFTFPSSLAFKSNNKISAGILTKRGFDLKIGSKIRHVSFDGCANLACSGSLAADDDLMKDAVNTTANITVYSLDGVALPITFPINGLDKVFPLLLKRTP